ncbi:MAG: hypothetical protein RIB60_07300 [Phycisphaerales bacterium]
MTHTTPQPAPDPGTLPSAVTFFLSAEERREVLRALRAIDRDRVKALRRALGLACEPGGKHS